MTWEPRKHSTEETIEAMTTLIAQETSGLSGALPSPVDQDLAVLFTKIINSEERYTPGFISDMTKRFES